MNSGGAVENPFALLGVPETYALDTGTLRSALVSASLRWHPDRFALADGEQRDAAEARMAEINDAHARLNDPLSRAEALLALRGAAVERGTDKVSCPAVLMAMLELRETAAEARDSGDPVRRAEVAAHLSVERGRVLAALADACAEWEAAGSNPLRSGAVQARLAEASYVCRTAQDLGRAEAAA